MKNCNTLASFRRRPESSDFNDILDSGLRRNDGNKVNGTAVKSHIIFEKMILRLPERNGKDTGGRGKTEVEY